MANIYDMSDTWNDGATTFTAIKMNVTDTASDASSLLMDLQVGGASKFSVTKDAGFYLDGNLIEQRNSTNAQTFNIYNTYTDASNYERGFMKWNSNVLEIGAEAAGTGTARDVHIPITSNGNKLILGELSNGATFSVDEDGSLMFRRINSALYGISIGTRGGGGIGMAMGAATPILFSSANQPDGDSAVDAGISRDSGGVLKVTDGSTGTGELIFIVPTSDPGISGALWNNGGTLAISA